MSTKLNVKVASATFVMTKKKLNGSFTVQLAHTIPDGDMFVVVSGNTGEIEYPTRYRAAKSGFAAVRAAGLDICNVRSY